MNICSPLNKYSDNICYPTSELRKFVIEVLREPSHKKYTRNELIKIIQKHIFIRSHEWKHLWKNIFKCKDCHIPHADWSKSILLSNFDIYNVLRQYESETFHYCGDFNIDNPIGLSDQLKKIKKYGAIILYHPNIQSVNVKYHWSGIWIDTNYIIHFDSENDTIARNNHLYSIMKIIQSIIPKIKKIKYNTIDIQLDDVNCGLFAIDFIVSQINGINFKKWLSNYSTMISNMSGDDYIDILMNLRYKYFI